LHILVIEDVWTDFRLIQEYLRGSPPYHYELYNTETLSEGKAFLASPPCPIDVLLVDLGLPDSIGYDTFDDLHQSFPQYPIVVLTSMNEANTHAEHIGLKAIKNGAQDFLSKNDLDSQVLSRTIRYAIERKQMLLRLEQAQELAHMGSWELDLQTNRMRCSPPLKKIFGLGAGREVRSLRDYLQAVHREDQPSVARAVRQAFEQGKTVTVDHRIALADGQLRHATMKGQIEFDDQQRPYKVVGTTQDITQRRQLETLKTEKELATKTAQLRQDFLAKTSHEIRTPLNPILLLTDMLLRTQIDAEQREYLNVIRTAGGTLLALVNDILDLSKIEAGKIKFACEPFRLVQVFDSLRSMMEPTAHRKGLSLIIEEEEQLPEVLQGDTVRLTQILLNLVGNALKFTQQGYVKVGVATQRWEPGQVWLRFTVEDSGIGIPLDKRKLIFEGFQQVDSEANRRQGGTGLGLTIVRQLVVLQGGQISVESQPGKGSTFWFDLPLGIEKGATPPPSEPPEPQRDHKLDLSLLEGARVLVVEDNPLNQMVTKKLLDTWSVEAVIANNGREGVDVLASRPFDVVLMDIQMPEMDGYEATRYIRKRLPPSRAQVPIIALTANAFTGSDDECLRAGMDDYLSKPIEIHNLFDKLVKHFSPAVSAPAQRMDHPRIPTSAPSSSGLTTLLPTSTQTDRMNQGTFIDLSQLEQISGGDRDIMQKTIEAFLKTTPGMLEDIDEKLSAGDHDGLSKAAHKLKGSAGAIGITDAQQILDELQIKAKKQSDLSTLQSLVEEAKEKTEGAMAELQAFLS